MDPNNPGGRFLFVAIAVSMAIVLGLRRAAPDKPWLGIFLAVLFGPCGHLYLPGAARYIVLMYAAWAVLLRFTPLPPTVSGLLLSVLSGLLMNARMQKPATPPTPPQAPEIHGE